MSKRPIFDRLGQLWPLGVPVSLSWAEIGCILFCMQHYKIRTFVELGANEGGLATIMAARGYILRDFTYIGYDIEAKLTRNAGRLIEESSWANIQILDIFEHDWSEITWQSPMLIFCDNGDKKKEFQMFAPMLKHNDFIMGHDFGKELFLEDCKVEGVDLKRLVPEWIRETGLVLFQRKGNG